MKLMRNIPERKGKCKYALIRLDRLNLTDAEIGDLTPGELVAHLARVPLSRLEDLIEFGEPGTENEFFAIKLKDRNSTAALSSYSEAVEANGDFEFAVEIADLENRSGTNNPNCKDPD